MFLIFDAINMIKDIRRQGLAIDLWGALLNFPQIIGGLIFITSIEGQIVFVLAILTLMVAGQIHKRERFSRLTGLCHLPWLGMAPWLIWRLKSQDHSDLQTAWMIYVIVTVVVSLIFDARDVAKYFRGERTFDWAK